MTRRILIVGDDSDTTYCLKDSLELLGCHVDTERCEAQAVERIKSREYSAVILDIIFPGIRGFNVLRQLHQDGVKIPVIALSGHAYQDEVRAEGIHAFLAKPFALREFERVVERLIPPARGHLGSLSWVI